MPNRLPIPPDLAILIEKREASERRRLMRRKKDRANDSAGSTSTAEPSTVLKTGQSDERLKRQRASADRRQSKRRKNQAPKNA